MLKSVALQAELGPVFDVTLDCEDGAPVGGEAEHALAIAELVMSPRNLFNRLGARVHAVDHPRFADDIATLVGQAGSRLAYVMVPKPRDLADVQHACAEVARQAEHHGLARIPPVHVLIETHGALQQVREIAAHPQVQCLAFGLMDFVSAHRGAIPASAMTASGQFSHPLVVRAKLQIAAASHAAAKTPSHCVVTEFSDAQAIATAAAQAANQLGYTRMWSIHPQQIPAIVKAFAPDAAEVELATEILCAAQNAAWAPTRHVHAGTARLHDRASYRYFWQLLERAHRTGLALPAAAKQWFLG
jgi:citrate lyase subunit beta / citryl-CoA lyase